MIQPLRKTNLSFSGSTWVAPDDSTLTSHGSAEIGSHLGRAFLQVARMRGDSLAVISHGQQISYRELRGMALTCATELVARRGWATGRRVALQLDNGPEYIAAFYGILLAGGVVVPVPTAQVPAWINHVMTVTDCRWMIDQTGICSVRDPRLEVVPPISTESRKNANAPVPLDLAAIFFTSGSSGQPRGVMLSHTNFLANVESIRASLPIKSDDRTLAVLPFCHAYGNSVLHFHLLTGATLVIAGSTAFPGTLVDAMQKHGVTSFSGVPQLHTQLLRGSELSHNAVPTLRYATVAGGAMRKDLLKQMADRLKPARFFVMYGQTEATARLSCLPAAEFNRRCGSIGRGLPGVTLEVVDDAGRLIQPGMSGEIRAKGDNIMSGYWRDPAGTSQILRNGWLYTGDLATVDQDGYIYPEGRKNQLLKISGYRLHPAEIESVITAKIPSTDAVVVPYDSADGLTKLALFILPLRPGIAPNAARIRVCCARLLPHYQRPHYIAILDQPPLTASLKVDRIRLSQWAVEATNGHKAHYVNVDPG